MRCTAKSHPVNLTSGLISQRLDRLLENMDTFLSKRFGDFMGILYFCTELTSLLIIKTK